MRILSVMGSPRKNGNTAVLRKNYLTGVQEANKDAVKDDMTALYQELLDADVIIYATPIYTFFMSAQLKIFADRSFAVAWQLRNKKLVSLATYANPSAEVSGVLKYQETIKALSRFSGMEFAHGYHASTGRVPVEQNQTVLNEIYELGRSLAL